MEMAEASWREPSTPRTHAGRTYREFFRILHAVSASAAEPRPPVTDPVKQDAACRRPGCGQQRIKKRMRAILINVSRNHRIKRYTEECGIDGRDGEYCPRAKRLEQRPDESDVACDEMFQHIQCERTSSGRLFVA